MAGHAFLITGKAKAFLRGGLHIDPADVDFQIGSDICHHLLDMGLYDHIAIGSDFDGAAMDERLSNISQVGVLFEELEKRGLNEACINKIFCDNAYNFIAKLN